MSQEVNNKAGALIYSRPRARPRPNDIRRFVICLLTCEYRATWLNRIDDIN